MVYRRLLPKSSLGGFYNLIYCMSLKTKLILDAPFDLTLAVKSTTNSRKSRHLVFLVCGSSR